MGRAPNTWERRTNLRAQTVAIEASTRRADSACSMTTAAPSTALATIQPAFTDAERLALAGFLAGYSA